MLRRLSLPVLIAAGLGTSDALAHVVGPTAEEAARLAPALDAHPVYLCEPSPFASIRAAERPPGHLSFLYAGAALTTLLALTLLWIRRRELAAWWRGRREAPRTKLGKRSLAVIGVVTLGAVLRLATLGLQAMHEDEWSAVEFLPLLDVLFHGNEVLTNPPLLNFVEHFFYAVSTNPWWFRLPVALCGVGLVWAVWHAGRELVGERAGLLAALLTAVHAGAIVWSQTVRAYVPTALLLTLTLPYGWRLAQGGRNRDAVALGLLGALALWTHYLSVLLLVPLLVSIGLRRRRDRAGLLRLAAVTAGLFVTFLPLVPYFFAHLGSKQGAGLLPEFGPQTVAHITGLPFDLGWLALAAVVVAKPWRVAAESWLLQITLAFGALTLLSSIVVMQVPMYSLPALPLVLLLFAAAFARLVTEQSRTLRKTALAAVVTLYALPTALLPLVPSHSSFIARAARPFYVRGVSHGAFAERIQHERRDATGGRACPHLVTSPAFDIETYLYHFGRITFRDLGVEPLGEHCHMSFAISLPFAGRAEPFVMTGVDRMGDDRAPEEMFTPLLADLGCFWYSRMHQNCTNGTGMFHRPGDCRWLEENCRRVEARAEDELWYCVGGGLESR